MTQCNALRTLCDREGVDYEVAEDGCWNWLKGKTKRGYGWGHPHRRYWSTVNGPVPEGHHVHHKCRNPSCVNPDHLEPREGRQHIAEHRQEDSHVTREMVEDIRRSVAAGEELRSIEARTGLRYPTVRMIARGYRWANVGGFTEVFVRECRYCGKSLEGMSSKCRYCCHAHVQAAHVARKKARANPLPGFQGRTPDA